MRTKFVIFLFKLSNSCVSKTVKYTDSVSCFIIKSTAYETLKIIAIFPFKYHSHLMAQTPLPGYGTETSPTPYTTRTTATQPLQRWG